jgi:P27 family predicted phage terminase small subunit
MTTGTGGTGGKRGPKPNPTVLRLIKGGRQKKPNHREPNIPPSLPDPPVVLNLIAQVEWERIATHLYNLGMLTMLDRGALAVYCQLYARWVEAEGQLRKLDKDGATALLVRTAKNNGFLVNPLVHVANKAARDLLVAAAEFGMTPSARSRIQALETPSNDASDRFFTS